MAGLLAARTLADHFAKVTIVERDQLQNDASLRPGVPQARHVHILLARGQQILESLFPNFLAKLEASGVKPLDFTNDFAIALGKEWEQRFPSSLTTYPCNRMTIEWLVRHELSAFPQIHWQTQQEVIGLIASADKKRITGVELRTRDGRAPAESTTTELMGDLVIDASGRNSHAPQWLEAHGYAAPQETRIDAFTGYATRTMALRPDPSRTWKVLYLIATPPEILVGGLIWPLEDGKSWMIGYAGSGKHYPPTDDAGFIAFADQLAQPAFADAIRDATPLGPVVGFRDTANRMRHYERMPRLPDGFVVTGDAACTFNPIYGQGMSVAAIGAVLLAKCVKQSPTGQGLPKDFQRALAKANALPWQLATLSDVRVPGAEGGTTDRVTRLMHRYLDRYTRIIPRSKRAQLVFDQVAHLLAPPTALFAPDLFFRTLAARRSR